MPLPAALLAKLAKRGIVDQKQKSSNKSVVKPGPGEEVEEVFAEDYDDPSKPETVPPVAEPDIVAPVLEQPLPHTAAETVFFETTACPHRSNPYHECLAYCRKRYGMRDWDPDDDQLRKRDRMLRKYPLPQGWVEVGDYDTGRYYYWNMNTDEVSWLSPTHPKAQLSSSAEYLGLVGKIGNLDSEGEEAMETQQEEEVESDSGSDTSLSDEEDFIDKRGRIRNRAKIPELNRSKMPDIKKGNTKNKKEALDPMDPASYSDIPRGGWNEGLDQRGKAKTGVDVTASGPLFQQRPYPSPGDILRANQSLKKKK